MWLDADTPRHEVVAVLGGYWRMSAIDPLLPFRPDALNGGYCHAKRTYLRQRGAKISSGSTTLRSSRRSSLTLMRRPSSPKPPRLPPCRFEAVRGAGLDIVWPQLLSTAGIGVVAFLRPWRVSAAR